MTEKKTAEKEKEQAKQEDISKLSLAEKIARATGDMGAIKKSGTNENQKWHFITESDIKASIRKVMPKYGFAIFPTDIKIVQKYERKASRGSIWYFYDILQTFKVTDGHESIEIKSLGTGSDSGDKALNKAMTIAFKNMEKQLFNVSDSDDEDPDAQTVPPVSYQQNNQQANNYRATQTKRAPAKSNFKMLTKDELQKYTVMYEPDMKEKFLAVIFTDAIKGDEVAQKWWKETKKKLNTPEGQAVAQYSTSEFAKQIEKEEAVKKIKAHNEKKQEA